MKFLAPLRAGKLTEEPWRSSPGVVAPVSQLFVKHQHATLVEYDYYTNTKQKPHINGPLPKLLKIRTEAA